MTRRSGSTSDCCCSGWGGRTTRSASSGRPPATTRTGGTARSPRSSSIVSSRRRGSAGCRSVSTAGRPGRPMRFGVDISPAGPWGDPRTLAELARLAEDAGWDGVFVEDYVVYRDGHETYDPWIALAAVALATERVRIGPMVTPLPRRRPALVAAQAMTLDHLSGGRVVL